MGFQYPRQGRGIKMLENSERNEVGRNQSIYGSKNFKHYNPEVPNSIMDMDLLSYISGENKL